jgi:hypothetical protein
MTNHSQKFPTNLYNDRAVRASDLAIDARNLCAHARSSSWSRHPVPPRRSHTARILSTTARWALDLLPDWGKSQLNHGLMLFLIWIIDIRFNDKKSYEVRGVVEGVKYKIDLT